MKGEMITQGHLGGYVEGGDEATFYPHLWKWLVTALNMKSVLDIGCGDGVAIDYFKSLPTIGLVRGIDGVVQPHPDILQHDFIELLWVESVDFDLGWCCEFVEHVDEQFLANVMDAFKRCKWVLMTHASPGQQGHHHVNCRSDEYWKGAMAAIGFEFMPRLTEECRAMAAINKSPYNHFKRSGMAFRRLVI